MRIHLLLFAATALAQLPPHNSTGVTMGHLHLTVRDPDAHIRIWREVIGARQVEYGTLKALQLPGVVLAFRKGEPTGGTDDSAVNHLGFLTRDLDKTRADLVAAGCKIVRELPETHQFFSMWPDDVKIEFTEDKKLEIPYKHHHIHFQTQQLDEQRAWYARHFGAVPMMRGKFKAADLPGVNLSWNPADKPMAPTKGRSVDHIGFEVKNLEAFIAKLKSEAGIKFDREFTKVPAIGLDIAFFTDPWGVYVELTEGLYRP
jgi:catechol 2,3-dioxygenase-like lactoylglutathione lyase family enzyme